MKKVFFVLTITALVLTPLAAQVRDRPGAGGTAAPAPTPAPASQVQTEGWFQFIRKGDGVSISGIIPAGYSMPLVIPGILGGLPVTGIEARAFYNNRDITGVVIPLTVVSIGEEAFAMTRIVSGTNVTVNSAASVAATAFNAGVNISRADPAQTQAVYFPGIPQNEIHITTAGSTAEWLYAIKTIREGRYKAYRLIINGDIEIPYEELVYYYQLTPRQYPTFNYRDGHYPNTRGTIIAITGSGRLYNTKPGFLLRIEGETVIIDGNITMQGIANNNSSLIIVAPGTDSDSRRYEGKLELRSGTITGNTTRSSGGDSEGIGGGVSVFESFFTMSGGSITGNSAEKRGGGVYVFSGKFLMTGGTISGNSAQRGGGVFFNGMSRIVGLNDEEAGITMTGGTIKGNNAAELGGGLFFEANPGKITINGGIVYGNDASSADRNTAASGNNGGHSIVIHLEDERVEAWTNYLFRNTTFSPSDRIDFNKMPAAAGQTLNGWTRR